MPQYFALLSIVFMMGFVLVFDRLHWRRRFLWPVWSGNLMSQAESEQLMKIVAASSERLTLPGEEVA
jgi:hypothetical protein